MSQASHPFSAVGVTEDLRKFLEVFDDPGLAEALAPRPLKAFVVAETDMMNVFLDEKHRFFIRLVSTHVGVSEDGVLGLVCIDTCEDLELFVPIDRFTSWHAECLRTWGRQHPSEGNAETIRLLFAEEIEKLERLLAGPGPLADEIMSTALRDRMEPEPVRGALGIACEEEIFAVCEGMDVPIVLTVQGDAGPLTYTGFVTGTHRAYDGRIGFSFEADQGCQAMPFEVVIAWRVADDDVEHWDEDLPRAGGCAELEAIFADDIELMAGDYPRYLESNSLSENVSWDEHMETRRLARLAEDRKDRRWANGPEARIYLAMAQTLPESVEAVAVRVGGALWAEHRGDNAARVAWARRFVGFPVSDRMLVEAAESLDAAASARVQSAALFVACGGERATAETLRRLTLLQKSCPVPRFW